jgi:hypothetical protein
VSVADGQVVTLQLADNQLAGSLPAELGHLMALKHVNFRHNQLTGPVPHELGQLTSQVHLNWGTTN